MCLGLDIWVAETVGRSPCRKFHIPDRTAHDLLQRGYCKVTASKLIWKENILGPAALEPVFREEVEIAPGQDGISVHPAFGLSHMDLHVCPGNVFIMQVDDFGNPQHGRIHGGKHRLVFQVTG